MALPLREASPEVEQLTTMTDPKLGYAVSDEAFDVDTTVVE